MCWLRRPPARAKRWPRSWRQSTIWFGRVSMAASKTRLRSCMSLRLRRCRTISAGTSRRLLPASGRNFVSRRSKTSRFGPGCAPEILRPRAPAYGPTTAPHRRDDAGIALLLLGSETGRGMLATTRTVIVDEIHAVAPNKRGSHLALSLERLASICRIPRCVSDCRRRRNP